MAARTHIYLRKTRQRLRVGCFPLNTQPAELRLTSAGARGVLDGPGVGHRAWDGAPGLGRGTGPGVGHRAWGGAPDPPRSRVRQSELRACASGPCGRVHQELGFESPIRCPSPEPSVAKTSVAVFFPRSLRRPMGVMVLFARQGLGKPYPKRLTWKPQMRSEVTASLRGALWQGGTGKGPGDSARREPWHS